MGLCQSNKKGKIRNGNTEVDLKEPIGDFEPVEDINRVRWCLEYIGEDFELEIPNYTLKGQKFKPKGEVKFIYIFVHGLGYSLIHKNDLYPFITNLGGIVYACDHVGHGRSPGIRVTCRISEIRTEIENEILLAKHEYPGVPLILHGHSMGGLSSLSFVIRNKDNILYKIQNLILEAPWISDPPQMKVGCCGKTLVGCFNCTCPRFHIKMSKPEFQTEFKNGSDEPKWVKLSYTTPYFESSATGRLVNSALNEIKRIHRNYKNYNAKLPLLFLHGKYDNMVSFRKNKSFFDKLKSAYPDADLNFHAFELGTHCLLKCKERKNTLDVIINFIKTHVPTIQNE